MSNRGTNRTEVWAQGRRYRVGTVLDTSLQMDQKHHSTFEAVHPLQETVILEILVYASVPETKVTLFLVLRLQWQVQLVEWNTPS